MDIFNKKYIKLNLEATSKNDALKKIAKFAKELNIITDIESVYEALLKREQESTTGFKDGFAIPHARTDTIKEPSILFINFKKGVEWQSLDKSLVKNAFVLLIPKSASNIHLDILAKISVSLLDENFVNKIKTSKKEDEIFELINKNLKEENSSTNQNKKSNINIVGISACATGVVHTYMAKEALEKAGQKLNYNVHIETQGQKGQEYTLTNEQIKNADLVIIAADINVELDRFNGKKLIKMKTNNAIDDPESAIKKGLETASIYRDGNAAQQSFSFDDEKKSKFGVFMQHLLSGVSRMIPFVVFSGIVWAIINAFSIGNEEAFKQDVAYQIALRIANIGFTFFISIMGGYIADSIAGRAAIAPGFISTFAAANTSFYFWWNINGMDGIPHVMTAANGDPITWNGLESNISLSLFAALIMGFAAGYLVKWVNSWKVHPMVRAMMPILFIPVVCTSVLVFPFIFLLSGPLGFLMNGFAYGLRYLGQINGVNFLIGFILGAMIGFDMGGPINKIAGTTATSLITIDPRLMGSVATAIPVAPLAVGLTTVIFRKLFDANERSLGVTALALGFFGISEGAIAFATKRPKETIIANVVGSAVAGGLSFLFYVGGYVGMWGGPITAFVLGVHSPTVQQVGAIPVIFGGEGSLQFLAILWFFVAMAAGIAVHIVLYVLLISKMSGFERDGRKLTFKDVFKSNKTLSNNETRIQNYLNNVIKNNYYLSKIKYLNLNC